ncbi:hypothetical protein AAHZ94_06855 [Streptomyces sp. HSW2009]|uniref:hypothetical protein n=1 Tax=Streptomyces sp. HSW2009 TaxID=3142890 RepID=UPI0032F08238
MSSPAGSQRSFPSGADYSEALQNTQLCFQHPELKGARPEVTKLGLPRAISGAFASVFSLTSAASGRRYAVKCFTRHVPDQERRYEAISTRLAGLEPAELSQPWNLGFEYLPDAISVGRERYPVLKMEWTEAVTLSSWLDDNHTDRFAVEHLADRFEALVRDLAAHEIAHGDLQHGNLLVANDDTLRLVDYDGMYVPSLAGMRGTERGHRNYQSPMRGNDDFGLALDHFSAWVIYLSLKAIAIDPALWSRLHEPSGEFLLLTEEDFKSPGGSGRLQTLLAHSDQTVSGLADQVRSMAYQPLDLLPPLAQVVPRQGAATSAAQPSGTGAPPNAGGLPGWMNGHMPSQPVSPPTVVPLEAPPGGFHTRTWLDSAVAVLWPLLLVAAVAGVVSGAAATPVGLSLPAVVCLGLTVFARGRRPELMQAQAALTKLTSELAQFEEPAKAAENLRKDRAKFDAEDAKRTAEHPRNYDKLTTQFQNELKEAEKRRASKQRDIDKSIRGLAEEQQKFLSRALADKQAAYLLDGLRRRPIAQNPPHGIGEKLTRRLADEGIRTAADFKGYRPVMNATYNSTGAVLLLSSGREVSVHGIGEAKARALDAWRRSQIASVQAGQPTALQARERQSIEQSIAQRRSQLEDQRKNLESGTEALRSSAQKKLEEGQARLTRENKIAGDRARRQRQEFSRRVGELQDKSAQYGVLETAVQAARLRQRQLSYARYLHFLYVGR